MNTLNMDMIGYDDGFSKIISEGVLEIYDDGEIVSHKIIDLVEDDVDLMEEYELYEIQQNCLNDLVDFVKNRNVSYMYDVGRLNHYLSSNTLTIIKNNKMSGCLYENNEGYKLIEKMYFGGGKILSWVW